MPQKTDLRTLENEILRTHRVVGGVFVLTITFYIAWFWLKNSQNLSMSTEHWGQFGDFLGGIMNPLVAYAAYYWLTKSIRLQKEEMLEARQAMKESSKAQAEQAAHAQVQVRVAALTALINSIMQEVQTQRMQIQHLLAQAELHPNGSAFGLDGIRLNQEQLRSRISEINEQMTKRMLERFNYELELVTLLRQYETPN